MERGRRTYLAVLAEDGQVDIGPGAQVVVHTGQDRFLHQLDGLGLYKVGGWVGGWVG